MFLWVIEGSGVDVVLNLFVGEFIDVLLWLLFSGGCFIELGKIDICDG